jgi:molybdopterin adenylyltransferase
METIGRGCKGRRISMAEPLRFGILTVSDRSARGERKDASGPALANAVKQKGWQVIWQEILPDDFAALRNFLTQKTEDKQIDILLTTGGTGFGHRDVTPEATLAVSERLAPGLAEAMRFESLKITPHAMLSRGVAGICKSTLIVNLPGSPKGAVEHFNIILPALPHAVQLLRDDSEAEKSH